MYRHQKCQANLFGRKREVGDYVDAVLRHLITLDDYRDLLAIYNEAKNTSWLGSKR